MRTRMARRAAADALSVCRTASVSASARWMTSLVAHLPECARSGSLRAADRGWAKAGARFRGPGGTAIWLPGPHTAGAREMYCRNVYLRTGLTIPADGWVVDLGANHGLFAVWAAVSGARVVAVEAQQGFAAEIRALAVSNGVADRVHVEAKLAGGTDAALIGEIADERTWAAASHAGVTRPANVSAPTLMSTYGMDRIGLLKMDIEGGEFAVLGTGENLDWLTRVDQLALEIHPQFGDAGALVERIRSHGFAADLRDNEGHPVAGTSPLLSYAYCRRS